MFVEFRSRLQALCPPRFNRAGKLCVYFSTRRNVVSFRCVICAPMVPKFCGLWMDSLNFVTLCLMEVVCYLGSPSATGLAPSPWGVQCQILAGAVLAKFGATHAS